jgi:hypothetical protein
MKYVPKFGASPRFFCGVGLPACYAGNHAGILPQHRGSFRSPALQPAIRLAF